jgi:hypothetical protein
MLTGTFHASRGDVAMRAAMGPLLTAPALSWSVTLGIVIRPADNDVIDGSDVAELASCHSALREVIVVLLQLFGTDVHGLDAIGDDATLSQGFLYFIYWHVGKASRTILVGFLAST